MAEKNHIHMVVKSNFWNKVCMLKSFFLSYFVDNYKYDYWHCPHLHSELINRGDYFIDFTPKTNYPGPFDSNKIPLLDLSTQHWSKSNKVIYSPVVISQYGLGWYSKYLRDKQQSSLNIFLKVADWLINNLKTFKIKGENVSVFFMDYGKPNVLSGMAQGLAISVLVRAYKITKNSEYLKRAVEAFNTFKLKIKEGGVVDTSLGIPILEEWTDEPVHILNGHLFAFAGIIDLMNTKGLPKEDRENIVPYYNKYLESTLKLLKRIDMFFWTKYSLRPTFLPNIASYFYHKLHIEMMEGLYELTRISEFKFYSERWLRQKQRFIHKFLAMILKLLDRIQFELKGRRNV